MKSSIARAFESAYLSARFLRRGTRLAGIVAERGQRLVNVVGGTPSEWRDLFKSLDRVAEAKADREVAEKYDMNGRPRRPKQEPGRRRVPRVLLGPDE